MSAVSRGGLPRRSQTTATRTKLTHYPALTSDALPGSIASRQGEAPMRRFVFFSLILLVGALALEADTVKLKNGRVVKGRVVQFKNGEFTVEVSPGERVLLLQESVERSEEHTSELQSQSNLVCRLLLVKNKLHFDD